MNEVVDIERYLDRIDYHGPRTPTVEALHALTRSHAQTIPFENVDVLLRKPIRLEPEAVYRKLVVARRGGYCFEQNGLFLDMLDRFGFEVRPLSARVRLGEPDRRVDVVRTHLVIEARIDGQAWITDVGVGAASLTSALRWQARMEQSTPHEPRRLVQEDGRWFHQVRRGDAWVDVYEFTGESMPMVDRKVANWYTSTHPDSKFRRDLTVALALPQGRRVTLGNDVFTVREADGSSRKQTIATPEQLGEILHEHFGIDLPEGARLAWPADHGQVGDP